MLTFLLAIIVPILVVMALRIAFKGKHVERRLRTTPLGSTGLRIMIAFAAIAMVVEMINGTVRLAPYHDARLPIFLGVGLAVTGGIIYLLHKLKQRD